MKKLLYLFLAITVACSSGDDDCEDYPSLKVENNTDETFGVPIVAVELVGYDFSPLNIEIGEEQTFYLSDGLSGGYQDILVRVTWQRYQFNFVTEQVEVDFENCETTSVKLVGSNGNIYLGT